MEYLGWVGLGWKIPPKIIHSTPSARNWDVPFFSFSSSVLTGNLISRAWTLEGLGMLLRMTVPLVGNVNATTATTGRDPWLGGDLGCSISRMELPSAPSSVTQTNSCHAQTSIHVIWGLQRVPGCTQQQPAYSSLWDSTLSSSFIPLLLPPSGVHTARTPPGPSGRFYCVSHYQDIPVSSSPLIPDAQPIITDPAPLIRENH